MRRTSTVFLTALVMGTIIVGMCWRTALRAYAYETKPRPSACVGSGTEPEPNAPAIGMRYDALRLHYVSWKEPGTVVAAIENTEDHDLIFDLGVVFVPGFAFLGEDGNGFPGALDESVPVRPLRLAAHSVTVVHRRAKDLEAGAVTIPARLALGSTSNGKLKWVRVLERGEGGASDRHIARRGRIVRATWWPRSGGGVDLLYVKSDDWVRSVETAPGGHVFRPGEDRSLELQRVCAAMPDEPARKDIAWNVEFRETGTVAASTNGSWIRLELDTAKVHGHLLRPSFEHAAYGPDGHMTWSTTAVSAPILVYDADDVVVPEN